MFVSHYSYFFVGSGTTARTLYTTIAILVTHPDIQKRIQEEIDSSLSKSQVNYTLCPDEICNGGQFWRS